MNNQALLLDMDGVVLDSMPYHVAAWKKALWELGFDVRERMLYLYEGAIEPDVAVELFSTEGCTMDKEKFHKILKRQKEIFVSQFRSLVKPFPEVPDLISHMKQHGVKLGLVTSSHKEILKAVLPANLLGMFDQVITGDEVKRRKPHPDPYLQALNALGIENGQGATAVENAPSGILSAKSAGLWTVAITTTLPPEHLKDADSIISTHRQLMDLL